MLSSSKQSCLAFNNSVEIKDRKMPRAKSNLIGKTEVQKLIADQRPATARADCSVIAVSIVTGRSYAEAEAALAARGRKPGCGARTWAINEAVTSFGFKLELVDRRKFIDERYPAAHRILKSITTHHPERFPEAFKGETTMLFYTSNHVAAFKDGVIHDWTRGSARRVEQMFRVTPL